MEKNTEFIAVELDKRIVKKFKDLVRANGYSQKFVINKLVLIAIKDLENKEFNQMGGLFNAEKQD